jgi:hypothetical protein
MYEALQKCSIMTEIITGDEILLMVPMQEK